MERLANKWDEIAVSLCVAVGQINDFGLSAQTLSASRILIPVAYYLYHRQADRSFRDEPKNACDRGTIKSSVLRSLISLGFWPRRTAQGHP